MSLVMPNPNPRVKSPLRASYETLRDRPRAAVISSLVGFAITVSGCSRGDEYEQFASLGTAQTALGATILITAASIGAAGAFTKRERQDADIPSPQAQQHFMELPSGIANIRPVYDNPVTDLSSRRPA